jgi:aminopeptidase YwaD
VLNSHPEHCILKVNPQGRARSAALFYSLGMNGRTLIVAMLAGACSSLAYAGPVEDVSHDAVVEVLRALPTSRASIGDDEAREGLRKTEALLIERLKGFGYEPKIQEIPWVSPAQRLGRSTDAKDAPKSDEPKNESPKQESPKKEAPAASSPATNVSAPDEPAPKFWNNIIVDIKGTELPDEVIVIGAHFDAVPRTPGADDNGTGTAALVELARVLKDQPLKRTVRLIFFNLEEAGLIGSRHYATDFSQNPGSERLVGMISLEMLGFFCLEEGCQKSPIKAIPGVFEPPSKGDTLASVTIGVHKEFSGKIATAFEAGSDGIKITRFDFFPAPIPDILRSDHAPFLAINVPSIMLTDTANFRNPNYHKPTDTIDTLNLDRYVRSVRGVVSVAMSLANETSQQAKPEAK